jgi:hypothetical protein
VQQSLGKQAVVQKALEELHDNELEEHYNHHHMASPVQMAERTIGRLAHGTNHLAHLANEHILHRRPTIDRGGGSSGGVGGIGGVGVGASGGGSGGSGSAEDDATAAAAVAAVAAAADCGGGELAAIPPFLSSPALPPLSSPSPHAENQFAKQLHVATDNATSPSLLKAVGAPVFRVGVTVRVTKKGKQENKLAVICDMNWSGDSSRVKVKMQSDQAVKSYLVAELKLLTSEEVSLEHALEVEAIERSVHTLALGTLSEASSSMEICALRKLVDFAMLANCMYLAIFICSFSADKNLKFWALPILLPSLLSCFVFLPCIIFFCSLVSSVYKLDTDALGGYRILNA